MKPKFFLQLFIGTLFLITYVYTGYGQTKKGKKVLKEKTESIMFTPAQAGIWSPVQIFDKNTTVYGFSIALPYTKNKCCMGIETGLFPSAETFGGIQAGFLNMSKITYGFQAGLINHSTKSVYGLQAGALNIAQEYEHDGDSVAIQAGAINTSKGNFSGLQAGAGNIAYDNFSGFQIGFFNSIDYDSNKNPDGFAIQIGVFNFNSNGILPFCIGMNIGL